MTKPPKNTIKKPRRLEKKWREIKPLLPGGQWYKKFGQTLRSRHLGETQMPNRPLRLLTFNIQAGLNCQTYKDYVSSGLTQFLPSQPNIPHITAIGDLLEPFDIVALQELDGGSHRSGDLNQLNFLAQHGCFEFWHQQLNRNLGRFGQYSNGILSRINPFAVEDHQLPGLAGRGAILVRYGIPGAQLVVCCIHLALSEKARFKQLHYIQELLSQESYVIIMGDLNCLADEIIDTPLQKLRLKTPPKPLLSFPSWGPTRNIDHILVSPGIKVLQTEVIDSQLSDHRPVSMTIEMPSDFFQANQ